MSDKISHRRRQLANMRKATRWMVATNPRQSERLLADGDEGTLCLTAQIAAELDREIRQHEQQARK